MTVVDVSEIPIIAKEWYDDEHLTNKLPIRISMVAPNYAKGIQKVNMNQTATTCLRILGAYEQRCGCVCS